MKKQLTLLLIIAGSMLLFARCSYDFEPVVVGPQPPKATDSLFASFVSKPITSVNDPFWKQIDFRPVTVSDLNKGSLYGDGMLNMTGTFNGLTGFNSGKSADLILRAAYDNDNLYILAEWNDDDLDLAMGKWHWNNIADPLKGDNPNGWTRQGNTDRLSFAFEIEEASSPAGTFKTVGCAAACHSKAGKMVMFPETGKVDVWNWNMAHSEAMGYLEDLFASAAEGLQSDAGTPLKVKNNSADNTNRAGPSFEWNGTAQTVNRPNGSNMILDPGFFLLDAAKTPFKGDITKGQSIFTAKCGSCHGNDGMGSSEGPKINSAGLNRFSREVMSEMLSDISQHSGSGYFNTISVADRDDLYAFLRGLAGVPAYMLQNPTGSSADLFSTSTMPLAKISSTNNSNYKILITRKLKTGNSDDVQFDFNKSRIYTFGVALMDNDGLNHIGSNHEVLIFKNTEK